MSSIPSLRVECETPGRVALSTYGYYLTATWDSVPGGEYVISAATDIRGPWQELPTEPKPLTATGDQMRYALSPAAGVQFYRVMELPTFKPAGMVWISPGTFDMGSPVEEEGRQPDEGPQHPVTIEQGFWMGKYEVTQAEYLRVMGNNPSQYPGDSARPVESVTWDMATNYCARLTAREQQSAAGLPPGYIYRLPTEAEWEYACRAGTATRFSHGDDLGYQSLAKYAWYGANSDGTPHPVGQKPPNAWGLYDMHGNVFEICLDLYRSYEDGAESTAFHIMRGGSFYCPAYVVRAACRNHVLLPDRVSNLGGFRVVLARPG